MKRRGKGGRGGKEGRGGGGERKGRVFMRDNLYTYISVLVWFVDCRVMCRG